VSPSRASRGCRASRRVAVGSFDCDVFPIAFALGLGLLDLHQSGHIGGDDGRQLFRASDRDQLFEFGSVGGRKLRLDLGGEFGGRQVAQQ
jgi:hypothetical protein